MNIRNRVLAVALVATATMVVAQTPQAPANETKTPIQPAQITVNGEKKPGDLAVTADMADVQAIYLSYQTQIKAASDKIQASLEPQWNAATDKLKADIQSVIKANNWGSDVIYDAETKTWYRITKTPVANTGQAPVPAPSTPTSK